MNHFDIRVTSASPQDVRHTIDDAHDAFKSGVWSKSSPITRSLVLSRLARTLEHRIPELAKIESLQTGRAIRELNAQLGRLPEWLYVTCMTAFELSLTF
jgi:acyl-CoA reductase-like NAD-dependent aldehyde dehydrogenase